APPAAGLGIADGRRAGAGRRAADRRRADRRVPRPHVPCGQPQAAVPDPRSVHPRRSGRRRRTAADQHAGRQPAVPRAVAAQGASTVTIYYVVLGMGILAGIGGQMLLKAGADAPTLLAQILRPTTLFGLTLYGSAAFMYIFALRKI